MTQVEGGTRQGRVAEPVEAPVLPVGERIRRLRTERGMSQSDLGGGRLSKGFISQIESGRSRPSPESLRFIAGRLEVPLVALLPGLELAQQQAFLLRAADAAVRAREPREASALLDEAETLVQSPLETSWFHRLRAEVHALEGRLDAALDEALVAFDAVAGVDAGDEVVRACNLVGRTHHESGREPAALVYFDRAVELAAAPAVSSSLRALVNSNRGNTHMRLGDFARALSDYEAARSAAEDAEDLWQLAVAHMGLGEAARERGDFPQAIAHAERAVSIFERIEMRQLQAQILHNMGHAYAGIGDSGNARGLQERALAAARAMGDRFTSGLALERLAVLDVAEGHAGTGLAQAEEAVAAAREVGDAGLVVLSLVACAEACEALGDRRRADAYLAEARVETPLANAQERRQALLREGTIRRERGELEAAVACFEEAARIAG